MRRVLLANAVSKQNTSSTHAEKAARGSVNLELLTIG